jgi:stage V sporulation protein D (sporulation-specific penicillin-binding protein)
MRRFFRDRLSILVLLVSLLFFALVGRIIYIQVFWADTLKLKADDVRTREIIINPQRGEILDRNGISLAYSVKTYSVWADPLVVNDVELALENVSKILEIDKETLEKDILEKKDGLVNIKKDVKKADADLIKELALKGIWVSDDIKRVYPYNNFASAVIGHVNQDQIGIAGVEKFYNDDLTGIKGKYIINTDATGRQLAYGKDTKYDPINGSKLVLTIDQVIQHYLESAIEKGLIDNNALKVYSVVMDIKTGEILAMASKPDYNLNDPRSLEHIEGASELDEKSKEGLWYKMWRNPIVSDVYEPGSTFKIITSAIGLEENVVTPQSEFIDKGYTYVDGIKIRCWSYENPHGEETFVEALVNSCNPVFVEVARRVGKETFYDYLERFSIAKKTGIDLPAEANSILLPENKVNNVELATISFGQGISLTPIKMLQTIAAIVNGGNFVTPHVLKELVDENGEIKNFETTEHTQIISDEVSMQVKLMMESVVENSAGGKIMINGIRMAGKSGTAQKPENGKYGDQIIASFIGIAPVEDPRIAVLTIVDEPQGEIFGSLVAAPITKEIMEQTMSYLGYEPNIENSNETIVVPNVIGETFFNARKILEGENLEFKISSVGTVEDNEIVIDQYPKYGETVEGGHEILLNFK